MLGTGAVRCAMKEDYVLSLTTYAAGAADHGAHTRVPGLTADSEAQLAAILNSLSDDKAEDIV